MIEQEALHDGNEGQGPGGKVKAVMGQPDGEGQGDEGRCLARKYGAHTFPVSCQAPAHCRRCQAQQGGQQEVDDAKNQQQDEALFQPR